MMPKVLFNLDYICGGCVYIYKDFHRIRDPNSSEFDNPQAKKRVVANKASFMINAFIKFTIIIGNCKLIRFKTLGY